MTATPGMSPLEVLVDEVRNVLTPLMLDAGTPADEELGLSRADRMALYQRLLKACEAATEAPKNYVLENDRMTGRCAHAGCVCGLNNWPWEFWSKFWGTMRQPAKPDGWVIHAGKLYCPSHAAEASHE